MKNPYSVGKSIYLRAPEREDLDGKWYEWLSDPEISQYLADRTWPNNKDKQKDFFESFNNKSFSERLVLAICLKENNKHIGICNLSSINYIHRYADIAFNRPTLNELDEPNPVPDEGISAIETISIFSLIFTILKAFLTSGCSSSEK